MQHFSYSLFLGLFHSLWQAAVLLCVYAVFVFFIKNANPVYKRNMLFFLLVSQLFISVSTFFIYYTGVAFFYAEYIDFLPELFLRNSYIEMAAPWLMGIYMGMLLFKSARLVFNWQSFRKKVKASWLKPPVDIKLFTMLKAHEFGIRKKVNVWFSNAISTPITFGFFKPVILLPVALINNLSVQETETLIIHEFTHIKNNDYFLNWILIACETIFFFNPFVKIIASQIKLEREKNCDTQVLQFNYPALSYAETLLKAARFKTISAPFFLAAVFKNAQLIRRIRFFTEEKNLRFSSRNYNALSVVPILAILILNIFLVNFIKDTDKKVKEVSYNQRPVLPGNINPDLPESFSTAVLPVVNTEEGNSIEPAVIEDQHENNAVENIQVDQTAITNDANDNLVVPVTLIESEDSSKEMVINEENSATGQSVTKVFKVRLVNGEWKSTLMWTITEKRSLSDTLHYLKDSINNFRDTISNFINRSQ